MSTRIRTGLSGVVSSLNKGGAPINIKPEIGRVFGIVLDENTPSRELFDKSGGWNGIGTIFYLDFSKSRTLRVDQVDLKRCKVAKPLHASNQNYPLIGELVHLIDAPSPITQVDDNQLQKYYTSTINIWNNIQQNSPTGVDGNEGFTESSLIRNLYYFSGDRIYSGRKGNSLRFSSTIKSKSTENEWSGLGTDGDPITILTNGYISQENENDPSKPHTEKIGTSLSSIYLTSTQAIPLIPGANIVNRRVNTVKPRDYISSQVILNSDRITLNSKKDEVLLFAKTNIELNSDNIININAGRAAHINSPSIALGTKSDGSYPTEPVLLGGKTRDLFLEITNTLVNLAGSLASSNIPEMACAGEQLFVDIDGLLDKIDKISSNKVYTI